MCAPGSFNYSKTSEPENHTGSSRIYEQTSCRTALAPESIMTTRNGMWHESAGNELSKKSHTKYPSPNPNISAEAGVVTEYFLNFQLPAPPPTRNALIPITYAIPNALHSM